jgi:hypothetical protein
MRITYITIKAFRKWLKESIGDFDPQELGIDLESDESIKRFLKEYCEDLTYQECKEKIKELFPIIKEKKDLDAEVKAEADQMLTYYFSTVYVSRIFKDLYKKYTELEELKRRVSKFSDLFDVTLHEALSGISEEVDEYLALIKIFIDGITTLYNCKELDVRSTDLGVYGIGYEPVKTSIDLYAEQLITYKDFKPAETRKDLYDLFQNLHVIDNNHQYYLICLSYKREGFNQNYNYGTVLTANNREFLLVNLRNKN